MKTIPGIQKAAMCVLIAISFISYSHKLVGQDLWKTNPKECIVLGDTLGVKMTLVTLPPGASLAPHTHSTFQAYFIEGGAIESTPSNGKATRMEIPSGLKMQSAPMGIHSDKNVGHSSIRFLLVEIKAPAKM
jgi:quercetin dioxygenase-like cupin family protein